MKKVLLLMIIASFALSGCKFINEKILKKGKGNLEEKVTTLEQKLADKEAEYEVTLAQLQRESQAMIDSVVMYYENELSGKGKKYSPASTGTYYLIVGSFKTPSYAENYSAKIAGMGYRTQIVKVGYWNLVAAESYSNLREALKQLDVVREKVVFTSWIYVKR
jgi:cell division protein FtsN